MADNGRKSDRCRRRTVTWLFLLTILLLGGCKDPEAKEPAQGATEITGTLTPGSGVGSATFETESGEATGVGDNIPVTENVPGGSAAGTQGSVSAAESAAGTQGGSTAAESAAGMQGGSSAAESASDGVSAIRNGDKGYPFYKDGIKIEIDAPAAEIIEALGEPISYFEAAACAIGDLDRVYTYAGFQIYTYQTEGVDYISSVTLTDGTHTTARGISIGSSKSEVKLSYGNPTGEDSVQFVYESGGMSLIFRFEGERVSRISYVTGKL